MSVLYLRVIFLASLVNAGINFCGGVAPLTSWGPATVMAVKPAFALLATQCAGLVKPIGPSFVSRRDELVDYFGYGNLFNDRRLSGFESGSVRASILAKSASYRTIIFDVWKPIIDPIHAPVVQRFSACVATRALQS